MTTSNRLATIRDYTNAASGGPWTHDATETEEGTIYCDVDGLAFPIGFLPSNAEFIAQARTDLPLLLDIAEVADRLRRTMLDYDIPVDARSALAFELFEALAKLDTP